MFPACRVPLFPVMAAIYNMRAGNRTRKDGGFLFRLDSMLILSKWESSTLTPLFSVKWSHLTIVSWVDTCTPVSTLFVSLQGISRVKLNFYYSFLLRNIRSKNKDVGSWFTNYEELFSKYLILIFVFLVS